MSVQIQNISKFSAKFKLVNKTHHQLQKIIGSLTLAIKKSYET